MKASLNFTLQLLFLCCVLHVLLQCAANSSQTTIIKHTIAHDPTENGFWNRKVSWKSRWLKYWRTKEIYVPVWKKVWTPVVQNEWVPLPKPPPGWNKKNVDAETWTSSSGSWHSARQGKSIGWSGGKMSRESGHSHSWSSSSGKGRSGVWKGITRTYAQEKNF